MNPPPLQITAARPQRILLVCLSSTLLAAIGLYASYRLYLAHKIKVKIEQIRRFGLPVTTADLNKWYAPVPPDENAALILTNAFAHLTRVSTDSPNLPIVGRGKLPAQDEPVPPRMKQTIADYVATNRVALDLLQKGLALKSCRYPVDLTPGYNALLPHLAGVKNSAQLVRLNCILQIETGESDASVRSVQSLLSLAGTLKSEPLLISHLVRIACQQYARDSRERSLSRVKLTGSQLERLRDAFKTADESNGLERALIAERCSSLQVFGMSEKELREMLSSIGEEESSSGIGFSLGFHAMRFSGYLDLDQLFFL